MTTPDTDYAERLSACVLGATGAVGQRLVGLLADHPWFELREVQASLTSAGQSLAQAADRLPPGSLPPEIAALELQPPTSAIEAPLVFSALAADIARDTEEALARAGKTVVSCASSWRMDPRVPLVVPEVNPEHLELLETQADWSGAIATNPNCSTIGLVLALAPLKHAFGLESVHVVSLQALSGAGAATARSLDLLANVVPHIAGEEAKLESETHKILGHLVGQIVKPADLAISAQCNRVPVADGHTLCVSLELLEAVEAQELIRAWREYCGAPQELELPGAPDPVILFHEDPDAPQPRRELESSDPMAIHIGRLRQTGPYNWQFTTLSHNTMRGAAGGSLLLAELMLATGRMARS
ncbi:MAG: aspartate-semialdehyde dehydrogenase [bacterium]|nr:aspartate-semialdehyde dehydrogenase [Planctomycetota bacterium]HIL51910.1 aspartate-semialdehyde dehydrogenase [Planctomycetota bacterium]